MIKFENICCWSDTQIILSWIHSTPDRRKPVIANRVSYISENNAFVLPFRKLNAFVDSDGILRVGDRLRHPSLILTPISSEVDDIRALTPGHSLTTEPLTAVTTPDLTVTPLNRLTRWQLLQRLLQDFWRSKWLEISENMQISTLVLTKN
nr:unnamed protein product [Callosobruchus chinensis]